MCTVLVAHRCLRDTPLLLVANRDERWDRPTRPPHRWRPPGLAVVAGRDLEAGGTWLGVNGDQVVAGVLNRRGGPVDPTRASRGALPLLALAHPSAAAAQAALEALDPSATNPFTLFVADRHSLLVAEADGGRLRVHALAPGPHLLTTRGVDGAATPPEAAGAVLRALAQAVAGGDAARCLRRFAAVSRAHDPAAFGLAACLHGPAHGTVSSSRIRLRLDGSARFDHHPGPPCQGRWYRVPLTLPTGARA